MGRITSSWHGATVLAFATWLVFPFIRPGVKIPVPVIAAPFLIAILGGWLVSMLEGFFRGILELEDEVQVSFLRKAKRWVLRMGKNDLHHFVGDLASSGV